MHQWDKIKRSVILSKYLDYSEILAYDRQLVKDKDGLCGYVDVAGHEVIPCQYLAAIDFIEGYAYVKQESGWGIINADNEIVLPCIYDTCHSIVNGFAIVEKNHKFKLFELSQKSYLPMVFDEILPVMVEHEDEEDSFSGVMLIKEREEYRFYSLSSRISVPEICFTSVNKYLSRHTVFPSNEENKPGRQDDRLQCCVLPDFLESKGKFGIVNADFKVVVPFVYDNIWRTDYSNRHIVIRNKLFGLVNSDTGEILIDVIHGAICINSGYGYFLEVHDNGQDVSNPSDSYQFFRYINGDISIYDYEGDMVIPHPCDEVVFEDGVIVTKKYKDASRRVIQIDRYSFSGELLSSEVKGNIEEEKKRIAISEPNWSDISVADAWLDRYYTKYEYTSNESKLECMSEAPKALSVLKCVLKFFSSLHSFFREYLEVCKRMGIQPMAIPNVPEGAKEVKQCPIKNYLSLKRQAVRLVIHFFVNQTIIPNDLVQDFLKTTNDQRLEMTRKGRLLDILKEDEWVANSYRYRSLEKDFLSSYAYALSEFEKIIDAMHL